MGKKNFEDLTYVSKSTLGDLTKTAKEAAVKKGLILVEPDSQQRVSPGTTVATTQQSTGGHFFSSLTSDISGLTSSTSSMFSGLFGQKQQQPQPQQSPSQTAKGKTFGFDSFPGRMGLVERNPLIKHASPKQTQEDFQRQQQAERTSSNSENQAFLKDVSVKSR